MAVSAVRATLTSSFLDCRIPVATPGVVVHHTSYVVAFPAACATREWIATYTILESCPHECAAHNPHAQHDGHPDFVPPNFVVTTVVCDVCAVKTQTITCPNALGTAPAVIHGDGITATVVVRPTPEVDPPVSLTLPLPGTPPSGPGAENTHAPNAGSPPANTYFGGATPAPGASLTKVLVGGTPSYGGNSPVITAGAPRSLGLKSGLVLLTSLTFAAVNMLA